MAELATKNKRAVSFICVQPGAEKSLDVRQIQERLNAERAGYTLVCELGGVGEPGRVSDLSRKLLAMVTHGDMEVLLIDHPDSLSNAFCYSPQEALRLAYRISTMGITVLFSEDPIFSCRPQHTAYLDKGNYIEKPMEKARKYAEYMKKPYLRV